MDVAKSVLSYAAVAVGALAVQNFVTPFINNAVKGIAGNFSPVVAAALLLAFAVAAFMFSSKIGADVSMIVGGAFAVAGVSLLVRSGASLVNVALVPV